MSSDASPARDGGTPPHESEASMHIGAVAARTDLSLRSLRHWDEVGLITPSGRTDGGFRLYTEADVEKILLIRRMKPLGWTLEAMAEAMRDIETLREPTSDSAAAQAAHGRLSEILHEAAERRAKLVRQVAMADEFIAILNSQLA